MPQRKAAKEMGVARPTFQHYLEIAENKYGITVLHRSRGGHVAPTNHGRLERTIKDGIVLVGSDLHSWPGPKPTGLLAFCHFAEKYRKEKTLRSVVLNGDATDLARCSRHPPQGWTRMPETHEEIEATQEDLGLIEEAVGKAEKIFPLGNHDARFETYLASRAPEVANVHGTRLRDHFPLWEPCWGVMINNGPGGCFIKHRYKGGMYAPANNAKAAGISVVTGHNHSQKIIPVTTMLGTHWGVDTGCLANPWAPQFEYLEGAPRDWRAGFAVLTFKDGVLLPPELVSVHDEAEHLVTFRGEIIEV
ncbi:MAG: hypothetical protein AAGF48_12850 [Pseudomonadota bacterium]